MEYSQNKVIFFIIMGILWIGVLYGAWKLSDSRTTANTTNIPKEMTIWILWDDTNWYNLISEKYKKKYTEYKNTKITFIKQGSYQSYDEYEKMLLNMLADGNGPDAYAIYANGWSFLESKARAIPSEWINPEIIQNEYDHLFDELIIQDTDKNNPGIFLKWIPLWYESMGVFYNRDIIEKIPDTWDELDSALGNIEQNNEQVAIGLWLSSQYIPNNNDIISLFLVQEGIKSYQDFGNNWAKALDKYLAYWKIFEADENGNGWRLSIEMDEKNRNIVDLFVAGRVGVIFWFPSLSKDLEDSLKREGKDVPDFILTSGNIPQFESEKKKQKNIARYWYFGLSKNSKIPDHTAKFLWYLTTKEAGDIFSKSLPYYIPARLDIQEERKMEPISEKLPKTKISSFINKEKGVNASILYIGNIAKYENTLHKYVSEDPIKGSDEIIENLQKILMCEEKKVNWVNVDTNECP